MGHGGDGSGRASEVFDNASTKPSPPACSPALDALEALEQEHAKALQRLEREHGEALARAGVEGDGSEAVERLKCEQGQERSTLEQVFRWERHFLREDVGAKPRRSICG